MAEKNLLLYYLPLTWQKGEILLFRVQEAVQSQKIPHIGSEISNTVTISIGIATMVPSPLLTPKDLIQLADTAVYTSKTNGRNRISVSI